MKLAEQKQCTGCGACADACPVACISMETSEEGFLFPVVDDSRCTGCGICGSVCHVLNPPEKRMPEKAFAAWSLDDSVRTSSSSGGVYSVLGEHVLRNGGIIGGCRFDQNMVLKHELCDVPGCTVRFRGSKYVQCFTDGIYRKIKNELEQRPPMRDEFYHMDWKTIAPRINYRKASPLRRVLRFCKRTVMKLGGGDGR